MSSPQIYPDEEVEAFLKQVEEWNMEFVTPEQLRGKAHTLRARWKTCQQRQDQKLLALASHMGELILQRTDALHALNRSDPDVAAALKALGMP